MTSLFISYSRKDIETARKLTQALKGQGLDFWIDWEGIPPTVDWWKEIEKGIEEADIFLFLISPDSAKSKVCKQEIESAVKNGKRLIPLVIRDIKGDESPGELSHLNWIFLREQDDFDAALQKLLIGIQTDYDWVQNHRRLQIKALEWDRNSKDHGFLLRGKDLMDAETNLALNTSKEPHPTDLQREYVLQSRKATDRQRGIVTGISITGVIVLAALAVFGFYQASVAKKQAKVARSGELAAQSVSLREKNFLISLLLGVEAYKSTDGLFDSVQVQSALLENTQANPQLEQFRNRLPSSESSVTFSPDGKRLALSSGDGSIILWDLESSQSIGQPLSAHTSHVNSLAFSPDGKTLASGSSDNTIILWDVATHQPIGQPLSRDTSYVASVAFSTDGKMLASVHDDSTIILWDIATHQPIGQPLSRDTSFVASVAFSPDGKTLASGHVDGTIILWDIATHRPIGQPLSELKGLVASLAFSPDGKTLASIGTSTQVFIIPGVNIDEFPKSIFLWDIATHQQIGQPLSGNSMAFSPDGKTLASGSIDGTIILWDLESSQSIGQPLSGHTSHVNMLAFSPDGKTLISHSGDGTVILWDVTPRQPIGRPLSGHTSYVASLAFSPDGKTLGLSSGDGTIILWDLESSRPNIIQPLSKLDGLGLVGSLAFSSDGKMLALSRFDGTIILWDLESSQSIGQPLNGSSMVFSPDGKTLALISGDGTIILWDLEASRPIGTPLSGLTDNIYSLAFSSDGKTLISGSSDGIIILWDIVTRRPISRPLSGLTENIYSLAFSPDGKTLASGHDDGTIILWDVDPQSWVERSCQRAGRNFTRSEWEKYFPTENYRKTCEQWPPELEATTTPKATP